MTLLLGKVHERGVIIMADGLCRKNGKVDTLDLQKIFHVRNTSFVFAHHGQNVISQQTVSDLLAAIHDQVAACTTIQEVRHSLRHAFDTAIRRTLRELAEQGEQKDGVGFWIAGPDADGMLHLLEDFWPPGGIH